MHIPPTKQLRRRRTEHNNNNISYKTSQFGKTRNTALIIQQCDKTIHVQWILLNDILLDRPYGTQKKSFCTTTLDDEAKANLKDMEQRERQHIKSSVRETRQQMNKNLNNCNINPRLRGVSI